MIFVYQINLCLCLTAYALNRGDCVFAECIVALVEQRGVTIFILNIGRKALFLIILGSMLTFSSNVVVTSNIGY